MKINNVKAGETRATGYKKELGVGSKIRANYFSEL